MTEPRKIMSESAARLAGAKIAELMNIKPDERGRYDTAWGSKTVEGLARCVERIIQFEVSAQEQAQAE